jgi:large subunit ribosomal protein L13
MVWKTLAAKPEKVEHDWLLVDAAGIALGRLAAGVAALLRGKHKPNFTPHVDVGDYVIVVNASKVVLTGQKLEKKIYYSHSGYPGGLKERKAGTLLARKPEELFRRAVRGMLPRNSLGRRMLLKLKVYAGPEHPHEAQRPKPFRA